MDASRVRGRCAVFAWGVVGTVAMALLAGCGGWPRATSEAVDETAAAEAILVTGRATSTSPEKAALAAAAGVTGSTEGLEAVVILRFPPPDDHDTRVRVTGTGGFCRVWGASQVDLDGAREDGWVASGEGSSCAED